MKILYDVSVLGIGYIHPRARTGIFRVVENVARGLAYSKQCELSCCVSQDSFALAKGCLDYFSSNSSTIYDRIEYIHHPSYLSNYEVKLYNQINKISEVINQTKSSQEKISLTILRKSLAVCLKTLNLLSPNQLNKSDLEDVDIYHSPYHLIPEKVKNNKHIKKVQTIYDLIPVLYPQFFKFKENDLIEKILQGIREDDWVLCISESTKRDLCDYANIDSKRVFITYPAASTLFYPSSNAEHLVKTKRKYNIPDMPYLLSLCTLEPRKNLDHAIRCFVELIRQEKIKDLCLVLVGTKGWNYQKIFAELEENLELSDRIILTGYVADEDLASLYSGALAFVYPSLYEGFGLPPLEAMQCGIPVITSNTSSLPEVVGEAGIMVSPNDSTALCNSFLKLYKSSALRKEMSLKSIEQAKKFSWDKCVQDTVTAYQQILTM